MLGARHPVLLRGMAGQVVVVRWTPHYLCTQSTTSPLHAHTNADCSIPRCVFLIMRLHEVPLLLRTALPKK
jgi:hypothetical protein